MQIESVASATPRAPTFDEDYLSLEQVSKEFPRRSGMMRVVEDVSLTAARREVTVLLGPSGCGKSTLLRMVAGLDAPSAGRIMLDGNVITGPGRDRGMVFQSYTSFPWLSVRSNVEYGLRINGETIAIAEGAADYFIDRVKLTAFKDAYPDQLSGGMRQRVALARALATYPRLLLMDEPFGALDAETRWQMQELLMDVVTREQMTVLIVTHDIDEALFLGDQIVFLSSHPGRVREVLRPGWNASGRVTTKEALYDQPGYQEMSRHVMRLMREEGNAPH
jgi:NitT/TauT family transport system ATP-binding protein